jgi:hypothetical protein
MNHDELNQWSKRAADWATEYHAALRDRPVRAPLVPGAISRQLPPSPPEAPEPMAEIFADFDRIVPPGSVLLVESLDRLSRAEPLTALGQLTGIIDAGVAVVSLWLIVRARGGRRAVGAAVMTGLVIKILSEDPLGPLLRHTPEWDIAVAPLAHATGALAGLLCGAIALVLTRPADDREG